MNLHDNLFTPHQTPPKKICFKKWSIKILLNIGTPPDVVPRKEAPTTWQHHQPPTWFQELFLQAPMWQVSRNRLPWIAAMKILELGWRVKFFLGGKERLAMIFCSPQNNEVKRVIISYFWLVVSTNPSETYDRQIGFIFLKFRAEHQKTYLETT